MTFVMPEPKCIAEAECASGIGRGWWPMVLHLERLLNIIAPGWKPGQVKEKFGGLRFYVTWPDPSLNHPKRDGETEEDYGKRLTAIVMEWEHVVDAVESASYKICEECGKPGEQRGGSWIRTLCDDHTKGDTDGSAGT